MLVTIHRVVVGFSRAVRGDGRSAPDTSATKLTRLVKLQSVIHFDGNGSTVVNDRIPM